MEPRPEDDGRHDPGGHESDWEESWHFDFHTAGGELGGYVRLTLQPKHGVAWFWAALVGEGRPLVTVVDHEVALPRGRDLDLRAEGLWTSAICETPLEHWSVGLEAFGVALDDPTEAFGAVRGDRTALGLDLEWETTGPSTDHSHPLGYYLPCLVQGEVLVGSEVIALDGWGGRSHAWGDPLRHSQDWCTTSGRFDDGTCWHADCSGSFSRLSSGRRPTPGRLALVDGLHLAVDPRHPAPVLVAGLDGRASHLARALCRYTALDGRTGAGWTEWNQAP